MGQRVITALNHLHILKIIIIIMKRKKREILRKKGKKKERKDSWIISNEGRREKGADRRSKYVFFYKFVFTLILPIMHFKVLLCTHFTKKHHDIHSILHPTCTSLPPPRRTNNSHQTATIYLQKQPPCNPKTATM